MRFFSLISLLFVSILLTSCASSGRQISDQDMQNFVVGQTTLADIEAKLGQPTTTSSDAQGINQISYIYSHAAVKAQSFIPIAGAFIGGANSTSNIVTFIFDREGKLTNYNRTDGHNDIRTGISNGSN